LLAAAAVTVLAAALGGCGQRGPLALPESARPIERLPQPPATTSETDSQDDERENER
jgi:predicted small lipoprotein YifL